MVPWDGILQHVAKGCASTRKLSSADGREREGDDDRAETLM